MAMRCCVKGCHNITKLKNREQDWRCFSTPSVTINKGKELEELTYSKATKRMAGSVETQEPHFHAWRGGESACVESPRLAELCAPITLLVVCFLFCFSYVYNRVLSPDV